MLEGLIPIKMTRVTTNDRAPMLYLPREARRLLGLEVGTPVVIYVDVDRKALVVMKVEKLAGGDDERR
jgi:bifunctional DNA-binding transcriptional regulator/antitoxin component of YhaV-PrlF toxin-antitoxin module